MNTGNLLKNKWIWIAGGVIFLTIIIIITGEGEKKSAPEISQLPVSQEQQEIETRFPSDKIETLADFERSQFCKDYKCEKRDSWILRSGGVNHSYDILDPNARDEHDYISIEVVIENNQAVGFGLMYFGRETSKLNQDDLKVVYKLLESIDSTQDRSLVRNYIVQNVEKEVFQINQASPITWSSFNVYAGKIGQQTVSIEKIR